jgi:hypothetical protein
MPALPRLPSSPCSRVSSANRAKDTDNETKAQNAMRLLWVDGTPSSDAEGLVTYPPLRVHADAGQIPAEWADIMARQPAAEQQRELQRNLVQAVTVLAGALPAAAATLTGSAGSVGTAGAAAPAAAASGGSSSAPAAANPSLQLPPPPLGLPW